MRMIRQMRLARLKKADREKAQGGDDDVDYGVDLSLGEASDDDDDLGVDAYYRQAHMTYVRDYIDRSGGAFGR